MIELNLLKAFGIIYLGILIMLILMWLVCGIIIKDWDYINEFFFLIFIITTISFILLIVGIYMTGIFYAI
jgi:hypothetical protein